MPNGRCRMHGGTSRGAPKGNSNAVTHGIYSRKLTDEELEACASIELGNIDNELKLVRIRLMRIIENEHQADGSPELVEVANFEGGGANATSEYRKSQVLDYLATIDRLTARIASMELTRTYLMKAGARGGVDSLPDSKTFTYIVVDETDGDTIDRAQ